MADSLGFSFQPGADAGQMRDTPMAGGGPGGAARGNGSPQRAVRILSLRVPQTLPANAPVSRELLNGAGSAGPGGSSLTSMVRALMEAFKPTAPTAGPQFPTPQAPRSVASSQPPVSRVPDQVFQPQPSQPQAPVANQPAPQGPQFMGNIDTPPLVNAPPLDMGGSGGGGGADFGGNFNAYEALTWDDEQRQRYLQQVMGDYMRSLQDQYRGTNRQNPGHWDIGENAPPSGAPVPA